jgi:hypothetical protein
MKRIFTMMIAVFSALVIVAQAPERMTYQAVVRNDSSVLIVNTQIGMQISIVQGSVSGSALYVETHSPVADANGLIGIEIGDGTVVTGSFSQIDWSDGPYFLKTETDPNGGANYTISGTSQLLSVPYALYAKNAGPSVLELTDNDLTITNEGMTFNGYVYSYTFRFSSAKDMKLITDGFNARVFNNGNEISKPGTQGSLCVGNTEFTVNVSMINTTIQNGNNLLIELYYLNSEYRYVKVTHGWTVSGL